ncbi:MAG: DUF192 domain-containing protein [Candidatus Fervidibacter sp.]|uniref:DUF192 domain-containing protein n=1 Tax=Candidatus Fervidibacter sp. TaxID=3100871 RepID=UPI00404B2143
MERYVQVRNTTKEVTICRKCFVAETVLQRLIGLMGRGELKKDEGLLLTHARGGVHTCFMKFAIDVAYLNGEGSIVAVKHNIKPWRVWIVNSRDAVMALELPAGRLSETGTEVGDKLEFISV